MFDDLYEIMEQVCLQHEASREETTSQVDNLGSFDSVWSYLSKSPSLGFRVEAVYQQVSICEPGNSSSKEKKQTRKREVRLRRRRLLHESRESDASTAIPAEEDTPELCDYSSASDADAGLLSSDEEVSKEVRFAALRTTLESATKAVQNSPIVLSKRDKLSTRDRTISLYKKLSKAFPDGELLDLSSSRSQSSTMPDIAFTEKPNTRKITGTSSSSSLDTHIFIDSSNIYLGFLDALQRLHPQQCSRKPTMDLHALDTILERGRSSQVKSLVGSSPLLQSWDSIKTRDYEISILERVQSLQNPHSRKEQGVDELLHLKMMESILDSPPSTMVLASGDANIAQFSSGFFSVVLRALSRGWKVEVFAFRRSINKIWLDSAFRQEFKDSFHLYVLDHYVDELEI